MGRVVLVARYFLNLAIYSILLEGERADGYVRYSRKIVLKKKKNNSPRLPFIHSS